MTVGLMIIEAQQAAQTWGFFRILELKFLVFSRIVRRSKKKKKKKKFCAAESRVRYEVRYFVQLG